MCLYPKFIQNRKYLPNKKNNGKPPQITDPRTKYVPIGCGKCMECRRQKKRNWQVRLHEELRTDRTGKFVTLSYSDENLTKLENEIKSYSNLKGYDLDNETATLSIRRFLERWRKRNKTSVKHWLITELGQTNTERLHIHGIIFTNDIESIKQTWQYGNVWIGDYVNERTINYIVKYINKTDLIHPNYTPKILTSAGIGKNYIKRPDSRLNTFKKKDTFEMYYTRQGTKLPLPIYYRNKLYTDEQREQLWIQLLDKQTRYVNGIKIDISKNENDYYNVLKQARQLNKMLGYGTDEKNWNKIKYEQDRRNIKRLHRIHKTQEPAIPHSHKGLLPEKTTCERRYLRDNTNVKINIDYETGEITEMLKYVKEC